MNKLRMNAVKWQQLLYKLHNRRIPVIPGIIYRWIHFRYNCDLGTSTIIGRGTRLGHSGIGVVVNSASVIGRNCILAQNVTLASKDGGAPVLGDYVYVGANSVVLGGGKNRQ